MDLTAFVCCASDLVSSVVSINSEPLDLLVAAVLIPFSCGTLIRSCTRVPLYVCARFFKPAATNRCYR